MNPIALALLQGGVGFAIGAGTNDLAIRWIFHAVFAKKKREIGESVRSVISNELMTPDKVAARLASPESAAALQAAIEKHLDGICARDLPSVDEMAADTGDASLVQEAVDSVINAAVDELSRRLSLHPSAQVGPGALLGALPGGGTHPVRGSPRSAGHIPECPCGSLPDLHLGYSPCGPGTLERRDSP